MTIAKCAPRSLGRDRSARHCRRGRDRFLFFKPIRLPIFGPQCNNGWVEVAISAPSLPSSRDRCKAHVNQYSTMLLPIRISNWASLGENRLYAACVSSCRECSIDFYNGGVSRVMKPEVQSLNTRHGAICTPKEKESCSCPGLCTLWKIYL